MQGSQRVVKPTDILILFLLTAAAFLTHGYHPGAEDAEIYIPGVLKLLKPQLFPYNAEFFGSHAHLTLFPNLIAASVRISHLSLGTVLLLWQFASIFLLLLACWLLSGKCFREQNECWAGVSLVAALLTLPVAGTALYILDQYTNPRNLVVLTYWWLKVFSWPNRGTEAFAIARRRLVCQNVDLAAVGGRAVLDSPEAGSPAGHAMQRDVGVDFLGSRSW